MTSFVMFSAIVVGFVGYYFYVEIKRRDAKENQPLKLRDN